MQQNILIVCDAFPPDFAPRIGNLCKYLSDKYNITVVTINPISNLWTIQLERKNLKLLRYKLLSYNEMDNTLHKIGDYLFSLGDRQLYHNVLKTIGNQNFDIVLCTACYIFPLLCAKKLSAHFGAPLCIDLRDIMEQNAKPIGFQKIRHFLKLQWLNIWRRNRILKSAQVVTTVSPWHVKTLKKFNNNIKLIYNGYDANIFKYQKTTTNYFTITYTGRLYDLSLRNPTIFLKAMQELCKNQEFANSTRIEWFVSKQCIKQATDLTLKYNLSAITNINQMISAEQMPNLLNNSSVVLILTNLATSNGPHGIMTTKFFEALGCERPILCVRSDEDCLANAIEKTNAGIAARNVNEVKSFIISKFNEWQKNGFTHQDVCNKEFFTRQNQAKQFEEIFENCINKY